MIQVVYLNQELHVRLLIQSTKLRVLHTAEIISKSDIGVVYPRRVSREKSCLFADEKKPQEREFSFSRLQESVYLPRASHTTRSYGTPPSSFLSAFPCFLFSTLRMCVYMCVCACVYVCVWYGGRSTSSSAHTCMGALVVAVLSYSAEKAAGPTGF